MLHAARMGSTDAHNPTISVAGDASIEFASEVARQILRRDASDVPAPPMGVDEARSSLPLEIPAVGVGDEEALARLRRVIDATPPAAGPRFANQLFAGRESVATAADMVAAVLNNSMYTYKAAGPQVLVEQAVLKRMLDLSGMPNGDGMFTPGGSLSNLACMIVGRNEVVEGARDDGFDGRGRYVYTSAESHYSVTKNANMIGVGRRAVRSVEADAEGRMKPDALRAAIRRDRADGANPMMIIATSGTTVMGAFDPLDALADVAGDEGLWLHVDGAFGGTALLNPESRPLMAGIERADSFTWDPHKMMGVPLMCSVGLTRQPDLMRKHFDETASYLFQQDFGPDHGWLNPGTRSLQCGRRNNALKLWAQWQALGDDGYANRVARQLALASHAAGCVRETPGLELTHDPVWATICFEVIGRSSTAICEKLNETGELKVGYGIVHGRRVIRLVTVDPSLSPRDIERMIEDIARVGASAPNEDNAVVQSTPDSDRV
ncbi:MAG: pyridoxal-dependent decarboxylase [Phycisphaerales bacterium]